MCFLILLYVPAVRAFLHERGVPLLTLHVYRNAAAPACLGQSVGLAGQFVEVAYHLTRRRRVLSVGHGSLARLRRAHTRLLALLSYARGRKGANEYLPCINWTRFVNSV